MSRPRRHEITCPVCGATGEFILWESLNNVLNPDEAQQLIDGSLFTYRCPHCGAKTDVVYPCLYHDMKEHAMVQLVDADSLDEAIRMLDKLQADNMLAKMTTEANYRHRLVTSQNDLREKAMLFRDGLDDRAMEVLKLLVLKQLAETETDFEEFMSNGILLYVGQTTAEEIEFEWFIEQPDGSWSAPHGLTVPCEHYIQAEQIVEMLGQRIAPTYIIDRDWASQILLEKENDN